MFCENFKKFHSKMFEMECHSKPFEFQRDVYAHRVLNSAFQVLVCANGTRYQGRFEKNRLEVITHLDHISHFRTTSGSNWSSRWTYRILEILTATKFDVAGVGMRRWDAVSGALRGEPPERRRLVRDPRRRRLQCEDPRPRFCLFISQSRVTPLGLHPRRVRDGPASGRKGLQG